jgi:peptidyl-prolyl cis-trans isomerase C
MKHGIQGLLLLMAFNTCLAQAADNGRGATDADFNKPYVTVNGIPQPTSWAEVMYRSLRQRGAPDGDNVRKEVRDTLVTQAVIEEDAKKLGLDKKALLQAEMELARREVLVRAWEQSFLLGFKPNDKDIQAEYNRQVAKLGDKEYQIRHILVKDEPTAKLLIDKIKSGTKLETLTTEYSLDKNTKDRGGLSDWINMSGLLPPIADAVSKLEPGKVGAQPVHTNLGWHVIQLAGTRPFTPPTLDQSRQQVIGILAHQALEAKIKELRDKAKIE